MSTMKLGMLRTLFSSLAVVVLAGVAVAKTSPSVDNRVRGSAEAPLTIVEYSDFTCGYCLKFFKETWPRLQAKYVDTGKVRFLYKDYPRADQGPGVAAALAARCAGDQGAYWPMHDRLFAEGGRLDSDVFFSHAKAIGLKESNFRQCLRDASHLPSIFDDRQEANAWGFRGTPGFVLLKTAQEPTTKDPAVAIPGAFPFEAFAEEIEKMLATAPPVKGGAPKTEPGRSKSGR
ncbi:MAG: thioredoxin domain-containing protein [Nitrospiraceae bacterium]|nr:thioredoxin domain-containing protein [Nitrospiraceae bacterium]